MNRESGRVGDEAGQAVNDNHKEHDGGDTNCTGKQTLVDRILTKSGSDCAFFQDFDRHGQSAGVEFIGEVSRPDLG